MKDLFKKGLVVTFSLVELTIITLTTLIATVIGCIAVLSIIFAVYSGQVTELLAETKGVILLANLLLTIIYVLLVDKKTRTEENVDNPLSQLVLLSKEFRKQVVCFTADEYVNKFFCMCVMSIILLISILVVYTIGFESIVLDIADWFAVGELLLLSIKKSRKNS